MMLDTSYLEFSIMEFMDEDELLDVWVHLKDKSILVFKNVLFDPSVSHNILSVTHDDVLKMTSLVPFSYVTHISYRTYAPPVRSRQDAVSDAGEDPS